MLPYLISYFCLGIDPIYNKACTNGLNAAVIQIHLKDNMDLLQNKVETEVTKRTGKEIWTVGLTGYQMYYKQALFFSVEAKPIANSISGNFTKQDGNLNFTWTF